MHENIYRLMERYEKKMPGEYSSIKQVVSRCRPIDNELLFEWKEKHDLKIYEDKRYFYDTVFSYIYCSKHQLKMVFDFFVENKISTKKMTAFDFYNGNGLTTLDISKKFMKALYFNTCKNQENIDLRKENIFQWNKLIKVDVLFSMQVIEHYFEPIKHIEELMKSNSDIIVLGHGFDDDIWVGHFTYYKFEDKLIHHLKIFRNLENILLRKYNLIYTNDRGKIRIYKKK